MPQKTLDWMPRKASENSFSKTFIHWFHCDRHLRDNTQLAPDPITRKAVLIVGGNGEFGQFLQQSILPRLGVGNVLAIDRETRHEEKIGTLQRARHIVLATPLAGYAELACDLVYECHARKTLTTLWFIPSVQSGVWRAVTGALEGVGNPLLSAVCVHPMYGPNGFRVT